jgi:hypothetical protein
LVGRRKGGVNIILVMDPELGVVLIGVLNDAHDEDAAAAALYEEVLWYLFLTSRIRHPIYRSAIDPLQEGSPWWYLYQNGDDESFCTKLGMQDSTLS